MSGLPGLGYYAQQYLPADPRRPIDGYVHTDHMGMNGDGSTTNGMTNGGQTLDEIILQNNLEMMRRRTYHQHPQFRPSNPENHVRRSSMLEFGVPLSDNLANFQFDPNPAPPGVPISIGDMATAQKPPDPRKVRSRESLNVDTDFPPMDSAYGAFPNVPSYSPALMSGVSMNMESHYMPQSMDITMDYDSPGGEITPMNMHPARTQQPLFTDSPLDQTFPLSYADPQIQERAEVEGPTDDVAITHRVSQMNMPDVRQSGPHPQDLTATSSVSTSQVQNVKDIGPPAQGHRHEKRRMSLPEQSNGNNVNIGEDLAKARPSKFTNIYSSSGFDMLGVLIRVAQRPNPEINIGPVDLSCAFVVCDITKHDMPIVYCSDVFERLTGYSKFDILGRNCRFLQSPDGKVQAGVKRKYVDDSSVVMIKNGLNKRSEVQLSIINYRKGGQPFMNLLTMIPVTWDSDEFKYYVGFQVDLVEQPSSVQAKNPDGSYAINYQRGQFPRYVLQSPDTTLQADMGQTIGRDEVSTVLSTIGAGESDLSKRIWDKVLLENTDDVVHVLSLKGLFLYLSPASRRVLEYDASELVGTALSSVCHPSDIVPVTRELKDTAGGAAVNVVFRIRRKHSGYTWFESHGCLHTEQGKGRKCIILVGRQRPVYALARAELAAEGGIGDQEFWSKMSTSGMFLFVSSIVDHLLDRSPEDLVGTSIQALMRPESKREFDAVLEVARTGVKSTVKHDIQTRRGQVLQAQTTIFPGDAEVGQKPTFFIGQTKFVKMTRALLLSQKPDIPTSPRTDRASVGSATPSTNVSGTSALSRTSSTNQSLHSVSKELKSIVTNAGSQGLMIGNQDEALASEDNIFDELKTTRSTSWQFELRQMERQNRLLTEELHALAARKKKRKRRRPTGHTEKDCANCHTRVTPEWRRGPSGNRDLCNSCGLRWAKQVGRVSPRKYSDRSAKESISPSEGDTDSKTPVPSTTAQGLGGTPLASLKPRRESNGCQRHGNVPPKIEEEQEPPHETVLPA